MYGGLLSPTKIYPLENLTHEILRARKLVHLRVHCVLRLSFFSQGQYIFIHDALDDFMKFGDTTIESSKIPSFVLKAADDKSQLVKQFQVRFANTHFPRNAKNCSFNMLHHQ